MEFHRGDGASRLFVDLLLAAKTPIVGEPGDARMLLAERDLLVIQVEFRSVAPRDLHTLFSTKSALQNSSFRTGGMRKVLCGNPAKSSQVRSSSIMRSSKITLVNSTFEKPCFRDGTIWLIPLEIPGNAIFHAMLKRTTSDNNKRRLVNSVALVQVLLSLSRRPPILIVTSS
jgi:hypothetical protein